MSRHRRITALIVSLLLLPSTVAGGWTECSMGVGGGGTTSVAAPADAHAAHVAAADHEAHLGNAVASSDATPSRSPASQPHMPAACLAVTGCVSVALAAPYDLIPSAAPHSGHVVDERAVAPLSPALALEPPPPRV